MFFPKIIRQYFQLSRLSPFTSFTIHYSSVILSFDAVWPELLIVDSSKTQINEESKQLVSCHRPQPDESNLSVSFYFTSILTLTSYPGLLLVSGFLIWFSVTTSHLVHATCSTHLVRDCITFPNFGKTNNYANFSPFISERFPSSLCDLRLRTSFRTWHKNVR